VLNHWRKD